MRPCRPFLALFVLAIATTGCVFDDSAVNAVSCATSADCGGATCVDGICVFAAPDGSPDSPDQVLDTDLGDVELCGTLPCPAGTECCAGTCCAAEESCCDGACTNPAFDGQHCGACGQACTVNQACVSGQCQCRPRFDECDGDDATICETEVLASIEHCGECDAPCADNAPDCVEGACACGSGPCDLLETCCPVGAGKACLDTANSTFNCGACGTECRPGEMCVGGLCQCADEPGQAACDSGEVCCVGGCVDQTVGCTCGTETCGPTETCCGTTCVETATAATHCGQCGRNCGEASCSDGVCVCAQGRACDVDSTTTCLDVLSDADHCGACGNACATEEACCAGTCVLVDGDDAENCGACGLHCDGACSGGLCACAAGAKDLTRDEAHCGACGNKCDDHPEVNKGSTGCSDGRCAYVCSGGFADCDPEAAGCETALATSDAHCGQCGRACMGGASCSASKCLCHGDGQECAETGPNVMSATCAVKVCETTCAAGFGNCDGLAANGCETDVRSNDEHCGACDFDCDAHTHTSDTPTTCATGECQYVCDNADWMNCVSGPGAEGCETDIRVTAAHCGGCEQPCPTGATCTGELCKCDGDGDVCAAFGAGVASATCQGTDCALTCEPNFGDCDGNTANGCESDLRLCATSTTCDADGPCLCGGVDGCTAAIADGCISGECRCGPGAACQGGETCSNSTCQ